MFAEGGYFIGGMSPRESGDELLQRRLASGGITAEEHEERKALLDASTGRDST